MKLIVETDLGRDPDDYFALLYFVSAGADIKLITVSPGDPDQIAVARFLCKELGLDCPIGTSKGREDKRSCSGFHTTLLKRYGAPLIAKADGKGSDLVGPYIDDGCEVFVCGPVNSIGSYLRNNDDVHISRATMQGGFLGYDLHSYDCPKLDKFKGLVKVPTFNLNGDIKGGLAFINADIADRRFVSKNVCHTIIYDAKIHERITAVSPANRASEMLREGMDLYLKKHSGKKFHDPSAAVCHLHPEVATWVRGDLYKSGGGWGTDVKDDGKSQITAAINYDLLWDYIARGK